MLQSIIEFHSFNLSQNLDELYFLAIFLTSGIVASYNILKLMEINPVTINQNIIWTDIHSEFQSLNFITPLRKIYQRLRKY